MRIFFWSALKVQYLSRWCVRNISFCITLEFVLVVSLSNCLNPYCINRNCIPQHFAWLICPFQLKATFRLHFKLYLQWSVQSWALWWCKPSLSTFKPIFTAVGLWPRLRTTQAVLFQKLSANQECTCIINWQSTCWCIYEKAYLCKCLHKEFIFWLILNHFLLQLRQIIWVSLVIIVIVNFCTVLWF